MQLRALVTENDGHFLSFQKVSVRIGIFVNFWTTCLFILKHYIISDSKMPGYSFQCFPRLRVWWVILNILYRLTPKSWYQQTAQSSGNKLLLILWHNRLPYQQYDLLKTPLILALSTYNSKTSSVTPIFYYRIVISMIRCNLLQSLKKILRRGFRANLNFRKFKVALNPLRNFAKSCILSCNCNSIIKNGTHRARFWVISA